MGYRSLVHRSESRGHAAAATVGLFKLIRTIISDLYHKMVMFRSREGNLNCI
jgi:hypothetical protein